MIVSRFVPEALDLVLHGRRRSRVPTATRMITAATPIMMPSIVSAERSRLATSP